MQSCISAVVVLLILATIFTNASLSAVPTVKVEYKGTAVLPCTEKCSGVISWSRYPKDPLADCDQTSCRSVKEGYQMRYNQYLQGNLSLIITEADYSKRGTYTADCDDTDLCEVELQIEPPKTTVQIQSGESLLLELKRSDPVEVIYNSTEAAGPSSVQICTVKGFSLECKDDYKHRTSLLPALELRRMKESDSGVYTVRDTRNNEVIHIYTVTVRDGESYLGGDKGAVVPLWVMILMGLVLAVLLGVCAVLVTVIVQQKKEDVERQKL